MYYRYLDYGDSEWKNKTREALKQLNTYVHTHDNYVMLTCLRTDILYIFVLC
jgi:hypothetical protein